MTTTVACGTYPGWVQHHLRKEPACMDCQIAGVPATRHYWSRSADVDGAHFPVTVRPDIALMASVGTVLAESIRGAA